MYRLILFIACVAMALWNLPYVMDGEMISLLSMLFCSAAALWHLVMGAASLRRPPFGIWG